MDSMNNRNNNNRNDSNYPKTYGNYGNKRYNHWNQSRDKRFDRNGFNYRYNADADREPVRPEVKTEFRPEAKQDSTQSSQMPGFAIHLARNQSSPPFLPNEQKVDKTAEESGDQSKEQAEQEVEQGLDKVSEQLAKVDLKASEDKTDSKEGDKQKNEAKTESEQKSEMVSQNPNPIPNQSQSQYQNPNPNPYQKWRHFNPNMNQTNSYGNPGHPIRRNTIGNEIRFHKRYPRNGNEPNGPSNQFNGNQRMFRTNDRFIANNKFEPNDQNQRVFKPKPTYTHQPVLPMNTSVCDYPNPTPTPMQPILYNPCESFNPYLNYFIPNPYLPQPIAYPNPSQPMPSNSAGMNVESALNRKPIEGEKCDKSAEQMSISSNEPPNQYTPYFIPFEPTTAVPSPPTYKGHLNTITTDSGVFHYFVCVFPTNIAPLPLDVMAETGCPILPSNCELITCFNWPEVTMQ